MHAFLCMFCQILPRHCLEPQYKNFTKRVKKPVDTKKLRNPVFSLVVMDRHLSESRASQLGLFHQLNTNGSAVAGE